MAKYRQCGWATYSFYKTRKCRFHITVAGETLQIETANNEDGTRVDVCASGFWESKSEGIFDVKVFNPSILTLTTF